MLVVIWSFFAVLFTLVSLYRVACDVIGTIMFLRKMYKLPKEERIGKSYCCLPIIPTMFFLAFAVCSWMAVSYYI